MSYTASTLVNGQGALTAEFAKEAMKSVRPATFLAIQGSSDIMDPSFAGLRTREDRTVEAFTPARSFRNLGTGRSDSHTGVSGAALTLTPSLTTYSDPFSITLKQADNNVLSYQTMFNSELINSFKNFMAGLETAATSFVYSNRSQINVGNSVQGTFNGTTDVYEITSSTVGTDYTAAQVVDSVMNANALKGTLLIFCDDLAYDKFNMNAQQGAQNDTNLSFQMGNKIFIRSTELAALFATTSATYVLGSWVAVPMGSIAYLDWIPKQNREGVTIPGVQSYGSIVSPLEDGNVYAIHEYNEKDDGTSVGGYTQDNISQFEISQDGGFVLAPCTTSTETCLQAFAFVA